MITRQGVTDRVGVAEYVSGYERFDERRLPQKEAFYSKLKREHISDADYQHAQTVWEAFKCKTLGDYHDIYLRTDVLLLADVFETFRNTSLQHYGLDPAHYFTAPVVMKMTKVELELLQTLTCTYSWRKACMAGSAWYLIGSPRLITHNVRNMTAQNQTNGSCTWMRTISMAGR